MIKRRKPIQRSKKPLKKVSDKRRIEQKIYSEKRRLFLAKHFLCMVDMAEKGFDPKVPPERMGGHVLLATPDGNAPLLVDVSRMRLATEIHHGARRGKNYLNEEYFWAISRHWHDEIGQHPSWARARGYLA